MKFKLFNNNFLKCISKSLLNKKSHNIFSTLRFFTILCFFCNIQIHHNEQRLIIVKCINISPSCVLVEEFFLVFYRYSVDVENTIFCPILTHNLDSYHADFVYLIECISSAKVLNYGNGCQYKTRIYEKKKIRNELKV